MPSDARSPSKLRFYQDLVDEESNLREKWILKREEMMREAGVLQKKPENYFVEDVARRNIEGNLSTITRDNIVAAGAYRKTIPLFDATTIATVKNIRNIHTPLTSGLGNLKDDLSLGRPYTDLSLDPVMRPIASNVRDLLYQKGPCGRKCYLEKRNEFSREQKYYHCDCTSWDYGWHLGDTALPKANSYGRRDFLNQEY